MNRTLYVNDRTRPDLYEKVETKMPRIASKVEFFNESGERIWEPLHNRTVIAGAALTAMKLFNLNRNALDATPTYDTMIGGLDHGSNGKGYPTAQISGSTVSDETQRKIIGFCLGQGGAGLDISDVFAVKYCDCIRADDLVPFRYPLTNADDVDENVYKGKKALTLSNGQNRTAYYFKTFSNEPKLVQNYASSLATSSMDSYMVNPSTVYTNVGVADKAQSYVELHLKVSKDDCREFFIAHKGLENAKINQISLVSAWTKSISVTKMDKAGNLMTKNVEYFQDIRPFSVINIPTEIMSNIEKSLSIIYTLYF